MNNTIETYKVKQLLRQTIDRIDGAYADATIRAYRSNYMKFIDFCESIGVCALPAKPEIIASYIENLSERGCRSATIRQAIASIATIHTLNNYENPTIHSEVRLALKRMHRSLGRFSRQAHGINKELLNEMLAATDDSLRGLRDRALIMVAYDTMCRRGELIRLKVEDIDTQVIDSSGISGGYIFRGIDRGNTIKDTLTPGQVCRIYKRLASKAGFTKEFVKRVSGHSMRVGAAQDLLLSGASLPMIMARGRWSKSDTVMRYVEKIGVPI